MHAAAAVITRAGTASCVCAIQVFKHFADTT